jgi:hypothetical protein
MVSTPVGWGTPSSIRALQSSSIPLQISVAVP